jgi:hypothetical protein
VQVSAPAGAHGRLVGVPRPADVMAMGR